MRAPFIASFAVAALITACEKSTDTASYQKLDERLTRIEAQLSSIEKTVAKTAVEMGPDEEGFTVYLSGCVAKPGAYQVTSDMPLLAAVTLAGGLSEKANVKKITIHRQGEKFVIGTPEKIFLHEGDIVEIPEKFY
ncbi:hypothetical protein Hsar01_00713 [Haloferula sargassicola]|uniref:Soluble ligand binding domain-containing protein n=2 Tax=Haloferula sargassicola TaxID=490096 RepID=A0ABP9UQA8_9BACT